MNCNTEVSMRPAVTNSYLKQPWCPVTQEVDGMHFFMVDKWDRRLTTFCTGKGLNLKKGQKADINCQFIDHLQKLRSSAADEAVARAYEVEEDGDGARSRKKSRKAKISDADIADKVVEIEGPSVQRADVVIPGRVMKALFGIKNHPLWLELTAENLEYIRHGVLASLESNAVGRKWKGKASGGGSDGDRDEEQGDDNTNELARLEGDSSEGHDVDQLS
jgi:hypothetical protein